MSFPHRVVGFSPGDREEFGVGHLLFHSEKSQLRWFNVKQRRLLLENTVLIISQWEENLEQSQNLINFLCSVQHSSEDMSSET